MSFYKLILKSLWFYRKLNITVVLGVALATAILLGALIVGDSVKFSLEQITIQRLGKTSQVIAAGERLFRKQLANELSKKAGVETSALLRSNGIGVIDGGKFQLNQLAIWGVDSTLGLFSRHRETFMLKDNEAAINENLALLAGLKVGDELLLRVNKLNTFPANTPFVSVNETTVSFRITIARILKSADLGNFSLLNIQSSPRNVFLNLTWLNDQMKLQQKANVILVADGVSKPELIQCLQQSWKLEDINLKIRENQSLNYTELLSDRVFIEPSVEQYCTSHLVGSYPVFSYFINDFSLNGNHTPYSFVSTTEELNGQQMMVSDWLANDLKIRTKDTVRLTYFEVGPLRRLIQKDTIFVAERIYKLEGKMADQNLMPIIPGLSDVGNCRDWKTGVPVDLKKIRSQDESYWKLYKGTPKAFVSVQTAKKLWGNRFGQATAVRVEGIKGSEMEHSILTGLLPSKVGFDINRVKSEGLAAAANGVDFGQLFIGLSFFVLIAAFLLSYLLFKLFLGFRNGEICTLNSIGFSFSKIRKFLFIEASVLVIFGVILGVPFGILYDYLILNAINTIWYDIVRTTIAQIYVQPNSLFGGASAIIAISILTFYLILNRFLKTQILHLKKKKSFNTTNVGKASYYSGILLVLISCIVMVMNGLGNSEINPELFYISGFGLLPGLILLLDYLLKRIAAKESTMTLSFRSFILKRLSGARKTTLLAVSFLAIGIFLVVSTGLYRKDMSLHLELPASGTGGYEYFIETTLPVLFEPERDQSKNELGLPSDALITSFHVQTGDDASCLNLNRISRPRIIACNPAQFNQRSAFTFSSHNEDLNENHPWLSLNTKLANNIIPAFADQTVIQWGLGKKIGDTLLYKNEAGEFLKIKLIGGLENSIFQGNIIISEDFFVKAFPSVSGANFFLIQSPSGSINSKELKESWRHYGADIIKASERLLNFNRIENTYLNIFLMLGALGLLIGTVGLGILIFRITLEQIPEYALLQSIGFQKSKILKMLIIEKMFLVLMAVAIGSLPAAMSALPVLILAQNSALWMWLPAVSILVIISGTISSIIAVQKALKKNIISSLSGE